ncbi:hypothetical protein F5887DRAFT_920002 [Amanita rubescens]|nr:hypothetical protein F5887DRAFT_920002 [Amanita rubescens]
MPSFFANLTRHFSRSTVIATSSHPPVRHMSSKSKNLFYAYQKKTEWDLPSSEEKEAVERTRQAVRDNASQIRGAFREDRDVDWVIISRGGADAHDQPGDRHWTVRGFQDGHPHYTLHVFPGTKLAEAYNNGGRGWAEMVDGRSNYGLDIAYRCRRLNMVDTRSDEKTSKDPNEGGRGLQRSPEGDTVVPKVEMKPEQAEQNGEGGKRKEEPDAMR